MTKSGLTLGFPKNTAYQVLRLDNLKENIGYGTTNIGYGTTNTDAGVGIGLKRGDSKN